MVKQTKASAIHSPRSSVAKSSASDRNTHGCHQHTLDLRSWINHIKCSTDLTYIMTHIMTHLSSQGWKSLSANGLRHAESLLLSSWDHWEPCRKLRTDQTDLVLAFRSGSAYVLTLLTMYQLLYGSKFLAENGRFLWF